MAMVNVVTVAAYWLRLIGLVQRSAATWCCVLHSSDEPGELQQWHDESNINSVVAIAINLQLAALFLHGVRHSSPADGPSVPVDDPHGE